MARNQTAKALASRLEIDYFKKGRRLWFRRSRFVVTALCLLVALAFWGAYHKSQSRGTLYNPGPVSRAHASFENKCAECHDNTGKGLKNIKAIFDNSVSDAACLRCHDGAIHSVNQVEFVPNGDNSAKRWEKTTCTHCHIEHRGEMALRGTSDSHCIQCHEDLPAHTRKDRVIAVGAPPEPRALAFSLTKHPPFGRQLTAEGKAFDTVAKDPNEPGSPGEVEAAETAVLGKLKDKDGKSKLIDPTVLRFNHKIHLAMDNIKKFGDNSCTLCHTTLDPDPRAKPPSESDSPPWTNNKGRDAQWGVLDQRAYMLPVSYQKHCAGCHQLSVPVSAPGDDVPTGKFALPHDRIEVVRDVIAGIPPDRLKWIGVTAAGSAKPAEPEPEGTPKPRRGPGARGGGDSAEPTEPAAPPRRGPGPRGGSDAAEPAAPAAPAAPAEPAEPAEPATPPRRGPGPRGGSGRLPGVGDGHVQLAMLLKGPGPKSKEPDETPPETPPATGGTAPGGTAPGGGGAAGAPGFDYSKLNDAIEGASMPKQADTKEAVKAEFERLTNLSKAVEDPKAAKPVDYPSVVEFYAVYHATQACILCHNIQGSISAAAPAAGGGSPAEATAADEKPAATTPADGATAGKKDKALACMDTLGLTPGDPRPLQTVPTGIPAMPRRWYTHSRFDHAGHRNMKCVECHTGAMASTATCDVLSPNLVWTGEGNQLRSCAECHHPPRAADDRGAGADCQTCHVYHERTGTPGEGRPHNLLSWADLVGPRDAKRSVAAPAGSGAAPAAKPAGP